MKKDRQTKEKLLRAAKEEFLDKGYMKASLRNICRKAEVTTGAMYFFFQDKEDLFGSLVDGPLRGIYAIMKKHYDEEAVCMREEELRAGDVLALFREQHLDAKTAFEVTDYLYQYREEFLLLLTRAQGSRYENCLDAFVELSEQHYRRMADIMDRIHGKKGLDEDTLHCIVHLQMDIFTQPITHGLPIERAKEQLAAMIRFLIGGWYGLWQ